MSPEQARGHQVDKRSDIWSLGCVLYEMLTKQQPFRGETVTDALANIIHSEPVSIVKLRPDANAELERIIVRTLSKNRSERYQTASDLLVDLKQFQRRLEFEAELERTSSANPNFELQTQIIRPQTTTPQEASNSIAVLPFLNLSADPANEYFCDGLAEELLNALAKIDHLKVAARTSAFSFKGKNIGISEIGQKLSVKTVLEGSVRRSGNRLRITVQLINVSDGYQLWSERYDREMQDIFDVQEEITLAIVDVLKVKLFSDERAALLKRYTDNTEAYQLYLQGRYCYNKYTPEYFQKGIEYFEKAIELEPEYAPAYAGLGFCYGTLFYFGSVAPHQIVPKWRALIDRALEIDDRLADAYLSRASIEFFYDWDFAKAESTYQRAIDLNPNSSDAHWRYGHFLANCERFDEAISHGERAVELDPLSLVVQFFVARIYLLARRLDQGFEHLHKMQELEPNFAGGLTQLAGLYLTSGKHDEAIEAYQKALSLGHFVVPALSYLGAAYGVAGKSDDAHKILAQLFDLKQTQYVSPFSIARVYSGLGENDKAFEWFEKAFAERSGEMVALKTEALAHLMGNTILRDKRFQDLVRRVGMQVDNPSLNKTSERDESPTAMLISDTLPAPRPVGVATGATGNGAIAPTIQSEAPDKAKTKLVPLLIALLTLAVLIGAFFGYRHFSSNKQIESIAVLPFQNASNNSDIDYLADGISESLINSLTELQQLKVIARSTAFRYKGKEVDPQTVGHELNVRALLMGRVRQTGDNLNIQVDLVDANTGAQLWGREYERKSSDVLSVKQDIAREVTDRLRLRLSGDEQRQLTKRDTTNAESFEFYLRGRYYWNKRSADGIKKAIEQFQQAIDSDPSYALGYVGLADSYLQLEQYAGVPASEIMPKARAAVDRALQLDDSLSEAHATSANINQKLWRWTEAEEELKRAINLNPNYPTAHHWYAYYFYIQRQFDDAMREIERAYVLDPLSPVISENVANVYLLKNDLNAAIKQCQRTIELDPAFADAHYILGFAYLKQGRNNEATAEFQKAVELSHRASTYLGYLGYCYAVTGRRAEAFSILKELEEKYAKGESSGQFLAGVYAGLGDKDQVFVWLEKDFQQRSGQLPTIAWRLHFDGLRSDPRFIDLLHRMGLKS
jgi:serine/threonine-protein kinase